MNNIRKATFSVEKRTQYTDMHTQRLENGNCAIFEDSSGNYFETFFEYEDYLLQAQQRYKEKINQKMQKSAIENIFQEALISISNHHTKDDIIKLFDTLKEVFKGHELINLTIHKDEGYFLKDEIAYYINKNIVKKGDSWYISSQKDSKNTKDFDTLVNINTFKKVQIPHAHVVFSMFDFSLGRNARMQKKDMMQRLKLVAKSLNLPYAPSKIYKIADNDIATLDAKEKEILNLNNQISIKNTILGEINTKFAVKEMELEDIKIEIKSKNIMLCDILNKITQKEKELKDMIQLLSQKEESLENLTNVVSMKHSTINSLEATIKQKEFRLEELNYKLFTKEANMAM